ncbi:MAG: hypothetical protein R2911_40695 [Caldilineaceae bacterium]
MTENEVVQALPAYALNALEPDEMVAIRAFLETRPDLRQRAESLEDAAAQLTYAAPPVALPAHLRGRILEVAQADVTLQQQVAVNRDAPQPDSYADVKSGAQSEVPMTSESAEAVAPITAPTPRQRAANGGKIDAATQKGMIPPPSPIAPPRPATQPASRRAVEPRRSRFGHALGWKIATLAALAAAVVLWPL